MQVKIKTTGKDRYTKKIPNNQDDTIIRFFTEEISQYGISMDDYTRVTIDYDDTTIDLYIHGNTADREIRIENIITDENGIPIQWSHPELR